MSSPVRHEVDVQDACGQPGTPADDTFLQWVNLALEKQPGPCSITIRIVDLKESRQLNLRYRQQDKATNVLSFPLQLPAELKAQLPSLPLGDLVICAPLVAREASQQHKQPAHHWAHLTLHGVLHLLGHDHQLAEQALMMEGMETRLLAQLGIADPYRPQ